ncbi:MAG: choice-of-anchor J domain-containing protein [Candidatus Electrothrix scaldis]|nr:MAG: choice-of-anchor J domain-containing protein [Candidatus Electrothrix sp. GW3-3]
MSRLVGAVFFLFISSANLFAGTVVLEEGFGLNNACQIPVNWEVQDLLEEEHEAGSCDWKWRLNQDLDENHTGTDTDDDEGCFVLADSDECGPETSVDTVLVTPVIDCTDLSGTSLSFKYDAYEQLDRSSFTVEISTNNGVNWTTVWQQNQSDRGPKTATIDLSAEADRQSSVRIRFRYTASFDWWWQVDDVVVSSSAPFNWLLFLPAITGGIQRQ